MKSKKLIIGICAIGFLCAASFLAASDDDEGTMSRWEQVKAGVHGITARVGEKIKQVRGKFTDAQEARFIRNIKDRFSALNIKSTQKNIAQLFADITDKRAVALKDLKDQRKRRDYEDAREKFVLEYANIQAQVSGIVEDINRNWEKLSQKGKQELAAVKAEATNFNNSIAMFYKQLAKGGMAEKLPQEGGYF